MGISFEPSDPGIIFCIDFSMNVYGEMVATLSLRLRRWQHRRHQQQALQQREQWLHTHINHRAHWVRAQFAYYKHVIPVDYRATYTPDPMAWVLAPDLVAMSWPACSSQHAIFVAWLRVLKHAHDWEIDDWGGHEQVFVMTNSDEQALWITLKYSQCPRTP
jgi:hypothetical protein